MHRVYSVSLLTLSLLFIPFRRSYAYPTATADVYIAIGHGFCTVNADGGDASLSWFLQFDGSKCGSTVSLDVCAEACTKWVECVAFSHRGVPGDDTCVFYKAIPSGVSCYDLLWHLCYVDAAALGNSSGLARLFKHEKNSSGARGVVSHCVTVRKDAAGDGENEAGTKKRDDDDDDAPASGMFAYTTVFEHTWNSTRGAVGKITSRAASQMRERLTRTISDIKRRYAGTD
ncbi:hypothetical protein CYMTET_25145 [Cymbomonas tetramitiformis]|uniref:Apple domain-containing protein n=1 Tax=Cymbomonas tetramitiformis TaxID=36881 RepID=A0AAE0FUP6_9CHLO|nr:hypothetical protein CYMTET_25145 [Cymbomonas tetramitiformis]